MSTAPKTPPGSRGPDALATALMLTSRGFHVVAIHPGQKRPIGDGWGLDKPGVATLRAKYRANPGAGVGLCLGPNRAPGGGWLIDVEGDGPAAADSLADLLGGELAETMGWGSVRGGHHLFEVNGRFLDLMRAAGAVEGKGASAGVFKLAALPDLEFRIGGTKPDGTVKQLQSVVPPTPGTDGAPRRWNGRWEVVPIPDAVLAKLETIAEQAATRAEHEPARPATIPMTDPFTARASDGPDVVPRYVAAAVEGELRGVAEASQGGRNDRLNVASMKLGKFVAASTLPEAEAVAGLEDAARACGLTDPREVAATIRSGMTKGKAEPRDLSGVGVDRRMKPAAPGAKGRAAEPPPPVDWGAASADDLGIVPLSSVVAKPVDWLWPYRLARGEMALVAGEGGLGKSQVLLAIAAAMSNGSEWPDKSGLAPVGRTIILAAEDSPETTIKPRLVAMGADIDRITIIRSRYRIQRPGKDPLVNPVTLADLAYWEAVLAKLPDTRLLIVDPLPSHLGRGVNDSKNNELRAALEPFIEEIIRPRGIGMLSHSHLNKSTDSKSPIHRVNGSVAYANLARNVHFVVRDPDDPTHRVFSQAKCNNAPDNLPAIGFRVEARMVPSEAGEIETAVPVFDAETMAIDLHEAMTSDKGAGKRGPVPIETAKLAEFLVENMVGKGPVHLGAVADAAGGGRVPRVQRHRHGHREVEVEGLHGPLSGSRHDPDPARASRRMGHGHVEGGSLAERRQQHDPMATPPGRRRLLTPYL